MFDDLQQRAKQWSHQFWRGRLIELLVELKSGDERHYLTLDGDGARLSREHPGRQPDLTLSASAEHWRALRGSEPKPGFQTLSAMRRTGHLTVEGDPVVFYRHLMMLELLFAMGRTRPAPAPAPLEVPVIEPISGRYIRLQIQDRSQRIYFEEAGQGIPLICLHTAGADGRQYRRLLNDEAITRHFRVIAFDLPWHGKSSPPAGFEHETYQLTTETYMATVWAVMQALGLERPVVMGCSIGGRAVLHLAMQHGQALRAVIGLQSALYAENQIDGEPSGLRPLHRPDLHAQEVSGALMAGLIAPQSNSVDCWETLWHYMQGGPGVFMGDLHYYFTDGDLRHADVEAIKATGCPVYLLTGEYDTSATPALTQALADRIGAAYFKVMKGMGHFPMSENPDAFRGYLLPVLEMIRAQKP